MLESSFSRRFVEAGCDEAGRGCLAGPVVAAAVILPDNFSHPILNDSKQLNKIQRDLLRVEIEQTALCFAVAEVCQLEIDRINILNASFLAMHKAVDQLSLRPELLLIDGNRFTPYLGIPHQCIVKGDAKFYSIAAASVLAKTYRDALMQEHSTAYPHYGWESNVGYPTIAHRKAIAEHGISPLHRKSFRMLAEKV